MSVLSYGFVALQSVPQDAVQVPGSQVAVDSSQIAAQIAPAISAIDEAQVLLVEGRWQDLASVMYRELAESLVSFLPRLVSALVVFILFYLLYRVGRKVLGAGLKKSRHVDIGLESLLMRTLSIVAWVFIAIMVLAQFGFNVTALLAGLSVVGLAVGLAAQETLQNFIAGITILIDRPFRIGHFVEVDTTYGQVDEMTLRSTRVRTQNNEIMVLPNSIMINHKLINYSLHGALRIEIPFGIAYKEYPLKAREIVLALTEGDTRLHSGHTPDVVVTSLNNSSVDMKLRLFIHDATLAFPLRQEYVEKIREALREADIEIPFPHLQLFIDEAKAFKDAPFMLEERAENDTRDEVDPGESAIETGDKS